MPAMIRPPRRIHSLWERDSRRWDDYRPRADDIVIVTYPKCGTTWMQRIVGMLIFSSPEVFPISQVSIWLDQRFLEPIEPVLARLEQQTHRRFLKSHIPLDGLPLYEDVRYIHVARDGRDACMSYHNHQTAYTADMLERFDRAGLAEPLLARPFPRAATNEQAYFREWLEKEPPLPNATIVTELSFLGFQRDCWAERQRENVLFVHYNDLKADLNGEMRRVAAFLGIACPDSVWPRLVEAASFGSMRRDGTTLLPGVGARFDGGSERFFFKGINGRWRGVLNDEDLALYETKARVHLPPACARWLEHGSRIAGDPRAS